MYCIKCGVKLADSEKRCPLCDTVVYHPDLARTDGEPIYPKGRMPVRKSGKKALCGAVIILFMIPLVVCLIADLSFDGTLDWFGYLVGALLVTYVTLALPMWFKRPNPTIFIPCDFVAAAIYLLYVSLVTGGEWYLTFALPVTALFCLITSAVVTLLHYLKSGRLYIFGGALMALALAMPLLELLLFVTFDLQFIGWSFYPLAVLMIIGGLLIYLGINRTAREILARKLFF